VLIIVIDHRNWLPNYLDNSFQISRRLLVAHFEKTVPPNMVDTTLTCKIITNELPAIIYKSIKLYHELILTNYNRSIWHICPEYFIETQEETKEARNPLYRFIKDNYVYKEDNIILLSEVKDDYNNWLKEKSDNFKVKNIDYSVFLHIDERFLVKNIHICKSCKNQAKKDCCYNYNIKNRTKNIVIKNIIKIY